MYKYAGHLLHVYVFGRWRRPCLGLTDMCHWLLYQWHAVDQPPFIPNHSVVMQPKGVKEFVAGDPYGACVVHRALMYIEMLYVYYVSKRQEYESTLTTVDPNHQQHYKHIQQYVRLTEARKELSTLLQKQGMDSGYGSQCTQKLKCQQFMETAADVTMKTMKAMHRELAVIYKQAYHLGRTVAWTREVTYPFHPPVTQEQFIALYYLARTVRSLPREASKDSLKDVQANHLQKLINFFQQYIGHIEKPQFSTPVTWDVIKAWVNAGAIPDEVDKKVINCIQYGQDTC